MSVNVLKLCWLSIYECIFSVLLCLYCKTLVYFCLFNFLNLNVHYKCWKRNIRLMFLVVWILTLELWTFRMDFNPGIINFPKKFIFRTKSFKDADRMYICRLWPLPFLSENADWQLSLIKKRLKVKNIKLHLKLHKKSPNKW